MSTSTQRSSAPEEQSRTSSISDRRAGVVTACVVLSSVCYFLFSEGVGAERFADYGSFLWGSFLAGATYPLVEPVAFDWAGLLSIIALLLLSWASALLFRNAIGARSRDALPEVIVYAIAAMIVPPLILAVIFWPDGGGHLTNGVLLGGSAALAAVLLVVNLFRGSNAPAPAPRLLPARRRGMWSVAFILVGAVYGATVVLFALSDIRGSDSFGYHLPLAASWLEESRLATNVEASVAFFYPSNGELVVRWALALGTDRFAFVPAFVEAILCLYAIWKIARHLGASRTAATVAACTAGSCVLLAGVAASAYIDAFTALALLLAVLFLVRLVEVPNDVPLTIALGTAVGLAVGSKYSALQPALLIFCVWLFYVARVHYRPYEGCLRIVDFRKIGRMLVLFGLPVIVCSAYWYVRNAVEHGNPVYPFGLFGWPGLPTRSLIHVNPDVAAPWRWLIYPWREMRSRAFEDRVGGCFAIALVGLVVVLLDRSRDRSKRIVVLIIAGALVLWLMTGTFQPRYGIFPILLAFVFVGELWDRYQVPLLRFAIFATFASTMFIFGRALATSAVYTSVAGRSRFGVPSAVDVLEPAVILNATSSLANYYLMGADYRHRVIALFAPVTPRHIVEYRPQYVLIRAEDASKFASAVPLVEIARSDAGDSTATTLFRVRDSTDQP